MSHIYFLLCDRLNIIQFKEDINNNNLIHQCTTRDKMFIKLNNPKVIRNKLDIHLLFG